MSNYPDNFNSRAFDALYAPDPLPIELLHLDDAYDSVNAAIANMQQAVHYTNEALRHIITDADERHEWVHDTYATLHDKISDGYYDDLNTIEQMENAKATLPSLSEMLRGINKLQVAS